MLRAVGRLLWVPIAFVLAALGAGAVLFTLGSEHVTRAMVAMGRSPDGLVEMIDIVLRGMVLAGGLSVLPALALVVVGEIARIRSVLYYVVGGGLALATVPLLAVGGGGTLPPAIVWQVLATAGFAGGLVYWLLAGRRA